MDNHRSETKIPAKNEREATLLEFKSKLRKAEDLISKLGFSLREIREMKRSS